jgi:hypothetical protein
MQASSAVWAFYNDVCQIVRAWDLPEMVLEAGTRKSPIHLVSNLLILERKYQYMHAQYYEQKGAHNYLASPCAYSSLRLVVIF